LGPTVQPRPSPPRDSTTTTTTTTTPTHSPSGRSDAGADSSAPSPPPHLDGARFETGARAALAAKPVIDLSWVAEAAAREAPSASAAGLSTAQESPTWRGGGAARPLAADGEPAGDVARDYGLRRVGSLLMPRNLAAAMAEPDDEELERHIEPPCTFCNVYGTVRVGSSYDGLPLVTRCEVRRHVHASDCWIVSRDACYDVTDFLDSHPGGRRALLRRAGGAQDTFEDFMFHSPNGRGLWSELLIARVTPCDPGEAEASLLASCAVM